MQVPKYTVESTNNIDAYVPNMLSEIEQMRQLCTWLAYDKIDKNHFIMSMQMRMRNIDDICRKSRSTHIKESVQERVKNALK